MTTPLALIFYESLMPGSQLVNRLQDLGYRVIAHTDATTLVEETKQVKPFIMVVDLASHAVKICDVLRTLRQSPETSHIPILAFARSSDEAQRQAALEAGATLVAGDVAVLNHLPELLEQALEVEL